MIGSILNIPISFHIQHIGLDNMKARAAISLPVGYTFADVSARCLSEWIHHIESLARVASAPAAEPGAFGDSSEESRSVADERNGGSCTNEQAGVARFYGRCSLSADGDAAVVAADQPINVTTEWPEPRWFEPGFENSEECLSGFSMPLESGDGSSTTRSSLLRLLPRRWHLHQQHHRFDAAVEGQGQDSFRDGTSGGGNNPSTTASEGPLPWSSRRHPGGPSPRLRLYFGCPNHHPRGVPVPHGPVPACCARTASQAAEPKPSKPAYERRCGLSKPKRRCGSRAGAEKKQRFAARWARRAAAARLAPAA